MKKKPYTRVTETQIQAIKDGRSAGKTYATIAKELDLLWNTVRYNDMLKASVALRDKVKIKVNCKECGHFKGYRYRNLNKEEKMQRKLVQAQQVIKRATEMGLI